MKKSKNGSRRSDRGTANPGMTKGSKSHAPKEILARLESGLDEHQSMHSMFYWKGPAATDPDGSDSI